MRISSQAGDLRVCTQYCFCFCFESSRLTLTSFGKRFSSVCALHIMCVHKCGVQKFIWGVFLNCFSSYFFETRSLTESNACHLGWPASPWDPLVYIPVWADRHASPCLLLVASGDLNSSFPVCIPSTLSTESSS